MNLFELLVSAIAAGMTHAARAEDGPVVSPPAPIRRRGTFDYLGEDGRSHFMFHLARRSDRSVRVYILKHPSYGGRSDGMHETHRLFGNDRQWICWTGDLWNTADALVVAAEWAERTCGYIETGRFERRR